MFAAVEKHLDPAAGRLAAAGLDIPHYFLDDAGSAGTIIGALSRMQAVVSMRLHALIFAAGQGIPLAGVVYDPKVSAFLRYIGQENFADLEALDAENPAAYDRSGWQRSRFSGSTGRRRGEAAADGARQRGNRPPPAGKISRISIKYFPITQIENRRNRYIIPVPPVLFSYRGSSGQRWWSGFR